MESASSLTSPSDDLKYTQFPTQKAFQYIAICFKLETISNVDDNKILIRVINVFEYLKWYKTRLTKILKNILQKRQRVRKKSLLKEKVFKQYIYNYSM